MILKFSMNKNNIHLERSCKNDFVAKEKRNIAQENILKHLVGEVMPSTRWNVTQAPESQSAYR